MSKNLVYFVFIITTVFSSGCSSLHDTVAHKDAEALQNYFLKNDKANPNEIDENGVPPIIIAIDQVDLTKIKVLINNGADVNLKFKTLVEIGGGRTTSKRKSWNHVYTPAITPLEYIIRYSDFTEKTDYIEVVKLLISKGADVNIKNKETSFYKEESGYSLLHYITYHNSKRYSYWKSTSENERLANLLKIADTFIKNGAIIDARDDYGRTPLQLTKQVELAKLFIENGADFNAQDKSGCRPIHYIYNIKQLEYYLKIGFDINTRDNNGNTPLHHAIIRTTQYNWTKTWDVQTPGNDLFIASSRTKYRDVTDTSVVELLIKNGADINARNDRGNTILCTALDMLGIKVIELLLNKGCTIDERSKLRARDIVDRKESKLDICKQRDERGEGVEWWLDDNGKDDCKYVKYQIIKLFSL